MYLYRPVDIQGNILKFLPGLPFQAPARSDLADIYHRFSLALSVKRISGAEIETRNGCAIPVESYTLTRASTIRNTSTISWPLKSKVASPTVNSYKVRPGSRVGASR